MQTAQRQQAQRQPAVVLANGQTVTRREAGTSEDMQNLCTVCIDKESDTVFQACGHLCVCEQCALSLVRCPLCRTRSRTLRVFRA